MTPTLEAWIDHQYQHSARRLCAAISCGVTVERPGFGVSVRAAPGSIVASPVPGAYDPEPDYFFHWYRDAAVVIEALLALHLDAPHDPAPPRLFDEFLQFSLDTLALDGRTLVEHAGWRGRVQPAFQQYLRPEAELALTHGPRVRGETRLNADGSLDISRWPRPQHDGIASRAVALRHWLDLANLPPVARDAARTLLAGDLEYTRAHWREPCHDIWEEERGLHYYTLRLAAAALGADSGPAPSNPAATILRQLDGYWDPRLDSYRSRVLSDGSPSTRDPDISVILAAIHSDAFTHPTRPLAHTLLRHPAPHTQPSPQAQGMPAAEASPPGASPTAASNAAHGIADPRLHATLRQLEAVFARAFAINRDRPPELAPALGRYETDAYYGGGAWYVSTLAAAEFCYRAARHGGAVDVQAWVRRGDAFLATVRHFTPASGDLSEQFDRDSGQPRSARHLTWSYAAFITCITARRALHASLNT